MAQTRKTASKKEAAPTPSSSDSEAEVSNDSATPDASAAPSAEDTDNNTDVPTDPDASTESAVPSASEAAPAAGEGGSGVDTPATAETPAESPTQGVGGISTGSLYATPGSAFVTDQYGNALAETGGPVASVSTNRYWPFAYSEVDDTHIVPKQNVETVVKYHGNTSRWGSSLAYRVGTILNKKILDYVVDRETRKAPIDG